MLRTFDEFDLRASIAAAINRGCDLIDSQHWGFATDLNNVFVHAPLQMEGGKWKGQTTLIDLNNVFMHAPAIDSPYI
jgi:hypothetical protein